MDTDGNGTVDSAEFSAAAQALASNSNSSSGSSSSSSTSATDIFTKLDSNGDGGLSTDEFMAALKNSKPQKAQGEDGGMPPPPPGGMPPPPSDSSSSTDSTDSESIDKIFSALDTNQDGSVSADELAALFEKKSTDSSSTSSQTSTSASAQTSASTTETTTEDAFKNMRNDMLQRILSYYGSNASASNSTSLLSVSA